MVKTSLSIVIACLLLLVWVGCCPKKDEAIQDPESWDLATQEQADSFEEPSVSGQEDAGEASIALPKAPTGTGVPFALPSDLPGMVSALPSALPALPSGLPALPSSLPAMPSSLPPLPTLIPSAFPFPKPAGL